MRIIGYIVLALAVIVGLDWAFAGENFVYYHYWAPKNEQVKREIYEQTKQYRQGSMQRLATLCQQISEAEKTDPDHALMIEDVVTHEFVEQNMNDTTDYLRPCLAKARAAKGPVN